MPDPQRRVALVTGGAKRVGCAIVQRLYHEGFDVAFTYHKSRAEADELLADSRPVLQGRMVAIEADLTEPPASCERIAAEITREFGRLDVLVNNASIYLPGDERRGEMFAIHFDAPLLLCRKLEQLLRASRGHVVNMVDGMVERPWPKYAAYCASKAAMWNLTLSLARELAPEVTVNGIAPGVVEWPTDFPQEDREKYLQRVPLERAGTPEDVASLVRFLVTDGSYVTGQIIRLDGGRSLT